MENGIESLDFHLSEHVKTLECFKNCSCKGWCPSL